MEKYAWIAGWGKYTPERVMTNEELSRIVDTTDEWIRSRTGIEQRHIAGPKETTSSMAIEAARQALEMADVTPSQVDLIIVSTVTSDYPFPATANLVQAGLGCDRAGAFDLAAGCSGFVYGLGVAAGMIGSGAYKNILVIGAETLSRLVDWNDRATCVLFGDGAGAFLLQANDEPGGLLSWKLGSDGSGADLLIVPAGGTCQPTTVNTLAEGLNFIKMNGREVFRFATRIMGQAVREVLEMAGMNVSDVDLFIPHQANLRIINAAARYLEIPDEKVFVNVNRYGNTSSASIPIAFCEAMENRRIKPGDTIVLVGFGAGLTWAAAALQMGSPTVPAEAQPWWKRARHWMEFRVAPVKTTIGSRAERTLESLLEDRLPDKDRSIDKDRLPENGSNGVLKR